MDESRYRELFASFHSGDAEALRMAVSDDVTVTVQGDDPLLGGTYRGPDRVMVFVRMAARLFDGATATFEILEAGADWLLTVVELEDSHGRPFVLRQRVSVDPQGRICDVDMTIGHVGHLKGSVPQVPT